MSEVCGGRRGGLFIFIFFSFRWREFVWGFVPVWIAVGSVLFGGLGEGVGREGNCFVEEKAFCCELG